MNDDPTPTPDELARFAKAWRQKTPIHQAAEQLGIPLWTLKHIEAGRGFRHPRLLLLAMEYVGPRGRNWRSGHLVRDILKRLED